MHISLPGSAGSLEAQWREFTARSWHEAHSCEACSQPCHDVQGGAVWHPKCVVLPLGDVVRDELCRTDDAVSDEIRYVARIQPSCTTCHCKYSWGIRSRWLPRVSQKSLCHTDHVPPQIALTCHNRTGAMKTADPQRTIAEESEQRARHIPMHGDPRGHSTCRQTKPARRKLTRNNRVPCRWTHHYRRHTRWSHPIKACADGAQPVRPESELTRGFEGIRTHYALCGNNVPVDTSSWSTVQARRHSGCLCFCREAPLDTG